MTQHSWLRLRPTCVCFWVVDYGCEYVNLFVSYPIWRPIDLCRYESASDSGRRWWPMYRWAGTLHRKAPALESCLTSTSGSPTQTHTHIWTQSLEFFMINNAAHPHHLLEITKAMIKLDQNKLCNLTVWRESL